MKKKENENNKKNGCSPENHQRCEHESQPTHLSLAIKFIWQSLHSLKLKQWKVTISPTKLLHWFHSVEQFCRDNSQFSLNPGDFHWFRFRVQYNQCQAFVKTCSFRNKPFEETLRDPRIEVFCNTDSQMESNIMKCHYYRSFFRKSWEKITLIHRIFKIHTS